jgi:ubiquinone/menaquinone biosynthesis C-methylase UbiE
MSHTHEETSGIVIHGSRTYDLLAGPFIRTTDKEILARAGVAPRARVLDVGTGPGYLALAASRMVGTDGAAVGIDASPEMIDRAKSRAARKGSSAEYLVATAEALPFDDETFDVVVSRLVIHHLTGDLKTAALAEMARVLKPGGRILLVDMASAAVQGAHHIVAHIMGNRPDIGVDLGALLDAAGFTQLTSGPLMHGFLTGVSGVRPERAAQS